MAPRHLPARRLVAAALALIALASTVAPTQAEPTGGADDAQAQAWIDQARVAAEHKDFAAALRLLGQAHARSADARLLFAIGPRSIPSCGPPASGAMLLPAAAGVPVDIAVGTGVMVAEQAA